MGQIELRRAVVGWRWTVQVEGAPRPHRGWAPTYRRARDAAERDWQAGTLIALAAAWTPFGGER